MKCIAALLLLAGCAVGPNYRTPQVNVPAQWAGATNSAPPVVQWWTTFNDPVLNSLIERAVKSNYDLRVAAARVRAARAVRGAAVSDLGPHGDSSASYHRDHPSAESGNNPPNGRVERDLWVTGFDASWEIDIFGGVRRRIEAATADWQATEDGRRAVLVTVLAEVARNYMEVRGFQQRLAIAQNNIHAQQETLDITRARFEAGLTSELDVAQASSLLASQKATLPDLQTGLQHAMHRLDVLLGQAPGALVEELTQTMPIPGALPDVPVGLPSDLIRRRPDVRQAERELAAETARIGEATAELFPKFSLSGAFGLNSQGISGFDMIGKFWSVGPTVRWPILDAWRIQSGIQFQNARQQEALANFEQTVLTSLEDVENALVAYANERVRYRALGEAVAANRREVELANELYTKGVGDFLNVLDAQRSLFVNEEQLVQSESTVSVNLVALYKALGGGWESDR